MNDRVLSGVNGSVGGDIDRVLRDYFQSEMPRPWPRAALPRHGERRPPTARRTRSFLRLALAAAVAIGLTGYWALAGLFPTLDYRPSDVPSGPQISPRLQRDPGKLQAPKAPLDVQHDTTRSGEDVQIIEEGRSDGGLNLHIFGPAPAGKKGLR